METKELDRGDRDAAIHLWQRAGLTRPWNPPETDYDRAVDGPASAVLGIFCRNRIIATAMVGHDGHRGWVYYLAVDPSERRSGIGRRMMDAAEDWVRRAGIDKIQLMVRTDNTAAADFYDAIGYEQSDVVVLARWLER